MFRTRLLLAGLVVTVVAAIGAWILHSTDHGGGASVAVFVGAGVIAGLIGGWLAAHDPRHCQYD